MKSLRTLLLQSTSGRLLPSLSETFSWGFIKNITSYCVSTISFKAPCEIKLPPEPQNKQQKSKCVHELIITVCAKICKRRVIYDLSQNAFVYLFIINGLISLPRYVQKFLILFERCFFHYRETYIRETYTRFLLYENHFLPEPQFSRCNARKLDEIFLKFFPTFISLFSLILYLVRFNINNKGYFLDNRDRK